MLGCFFKHCVPLYLHIYALFYALPCFVYPKSDQEDAFSEQVYDLLGSEWIGLVNSQADLDKLVAMEQVRE